QRADLPACQPGQAVYGREPRRTLGAVLRTPDRQPLPATCPVTPLTAGRRPGDGPAREHDADRGATGQADRESPDHRSGRDQIPGTGSPRECRPAVVDFLPRPTGMAISVRNQTRLASSRTRRPAIPRPAETNIWSCRDEDHARQTSARTELYPLTCTVAGSVAAPDLTRISIQWGRQRSTSCAASALC